jgi:hypothetical protein
LEPLEAAGPCCINPHSYSHCGMPPQEPTSLPHFLVDRSFAVVWLNFSWLPIGGTPFVRLAAHCLESRPRTEGADFGICQTFAASPAEPGELPCWFRSMLVKSRTAWGQNPRLPRRSIHGRFTSMHGHSARCGQFLCDNASTLTTHHPTTSPSQARSWSALPAPVVYGDARLFPSSVVVSLGCLPPEQNDPPTSPPNRCPVALLDQTSLPLRSCTDETDPAGSCHPAP